MDEQWKLREQGYYDKFEGYASDDGPPPPLITDDLEELGVHIEDPVIEREFSWEDLVEMLSLDGLMDET